MATFLLVAGTGCSSTTATSVQASSANGGRDVSAAPEGKGQGTSSVPPPPAPGRAPSFDRGRQSQPARGPAYCVAARPDLHRSVVALFVDAPLRPETMSLLRGWIQEAWRAALPEAVESTILTDCQGALLCATFAREQLSEAARALQETLTDRTTSPFFQVRSEILEQAEERDHSDPRWRLQTSAWASVAPSPYLAKLLDSDPLPQGTDLSKVLAREAGAPWMSQVGIASLKGDFESSLSEMRVVILGAPRPAGLLEALARPVTSASSSPTAPASNAPSKHAPAPTLDPAPAPSQWPRVHIEKDAGALTQAIVLPQPQGAVRAVALEAALRVVVARVNHRFPTACRITVDPAGGVFSTPSIRVDGPYEDVQTALARLEEEARRIASDLGGPSESEWEEAVLRGKSSRPMAFACGSPPADPDAKDMQKARNLLGRRLGAIVWGVKAALSTDEAAE